MHLFVNEDGKVYLNVINGEYRKGLFLPDAKTAKNLDELVGQINRVIQRKSVDDGELSRLNIKLDTKDFKTAIPNDERIPLKELRNQLTIAASPDIFDSYSLHVLPLKSKAPSDFKPLVEKTLEPEEQNLVA